MRRVYIVIFLCMICIIPAFAQQDVQRCTRCAHWEIRLDAKFCTQCGAPLYHTKAIVHTQCMEEKRVLENTARFCPFCGKPSMMTFQEIPAELEPKKITPNPQKAPDQPKPYKLPRVPKTSPVQSPSSKPSSKTLSWEQTPPQCEILETKTMDEGLYHTSHQREVTRTMFTSFASLADIEMYYKRKIKETYGEGAHISVIRMNDTILQIPTLVLKFSTPSQNILLEANYYVYSPNVYSIEKKKKNIAEKIAQEQKPLQSLEQEIEACRKIIEEKEDFKLHARISDLERRIQIASNSNTFWQLKCQQEVLERQTSILMLCVTKSKK